MTPLSPLADQIAQTTQRVAGQVAVHTVRTPLVRYAGASEVSGATLLIKSEHQQRTGSFKLRGALSKMLSLSAAQRATGIVTASSGNHGLGVARALHSLGGRGIICVPAGASPAKLAAIGRFDVEIRTLGRETGETENRARALAEELGMTFISPYNDPDVIAGQGTIGREILDQLGDHALETVDAVVVSVGGGGLISGVAASIKAAAPATRIIGASPVNDAAMAAAVKAGSVVEYDARPTISDGTAGGLEPGTVTLPLCSELVDEWILPTEEQIRDALRLAIDTEHQLIEGAAATALAAGISYGRSHPGQTIVVVSCGGNISSTTLAAALGVATSEASPRSV